MAVKYLAGNRIQGLSTENGAESVYATWGTTPIHWDNSNLSHSAYGWNAGRKVQSAEAGNNTTKISYYIKTSSSSNPYSTRMVIYNSSGSVRATSSTVAGSTIGTTGEWVEYSGFDLTLNTGDYTMMEVFGSTSTNGVQVGRRNDAAGDYGWYSQNGYTNFTSYGSDTDVLYKYTGASAEITNIPDNSIYEETDTGKHYIRDPTVLNYEDVVYNTDTADDVTISGNTATKGSAGAGWNRGFVRSTQSISPSTGGGEVKWTGSRVYSMAGLDKGTAWSGSGTTYPTVEYALYPTDVYESGTDVGATVSTSTDAHIYKITMDSAGLVKYYVDGTLVHTSTVTASGTYYFAAMPYDTSDFVTGEIALPTGGWTLVS